MVFAAAPPDFPFFDTSIYLQSPSLVSSSNRRSNRHCVTHRISFAEELITLRRLPGAFFSVSVAGFPPSTSVPRATLTELESEVSSTLEKVTSVLFLINRLLSYKTGLPRFPFGGSRSPEHHTFHCHWLAYRFGRETLHLNCIRPDPAYSYIAGIEILCLSIPRRWIAHIECRDHGQSRGKFPQPILG